MISYCKLEQDALKILPSLKPTKKGKSYIKTKKFSDACDNQEKQEKWDRQFMYGILKVATRGFKDKTTTNSRILRMDLQFEQSYRRGI